jgi:hypothetical protein
MSFGMILMIIVSGGGGSDLLDWMPTQDYWKAKNVAVSADTMLAELKPADTAGAPELIKKLADPKAEVRDDATGKLRQMGAAIAPLLREAAKNPDAEVAARAEMLLKEFGPSGKVNEVRRLMAIRALGELKAKDAAPALKALADSKEPFVADYAARALAAIDGKPPTRPHPAALAENLQKDLWLLPKNCGLVAQVAPAFAQGVSVDKVLESIGEAMPAEQKDAARQKLVTTIQSVVEQVGNARLDAVTVGVADDVGNRSGYVVVVARGLYDPAAMKQAVISSLMDCKPEQEDGIEVLSSPQNMAVIAPSSDRLIMIMAPGREKLPIAEMVKAIKAGKGGLADNAEMVKLIKGVDTTKPIWAAAKITEAYAVVPFLAGFGTITLSADLKDDALEAKLLAQGTDANQVKENVASFEAMLAQAKAGIQKEAARMSALQPLVDFMESVKFQLDGATVTGTAALKDPSKFLTTFPMMMFGMRAQAVSVQRARIQNENALPPAQNVPPGQ